MKKSLLTLLCLSLLVITPGCVDKDKDKGVKKEGQKVETRDKKEKERKKKEKEDKKYKKGKAPKKGKAKAPKKGKAKAAPKKEKEIKKTAPEMMPEPMEEEAGFYPKEY